VSHWLAGKALHDQDPENAPDLDIDGIAAHVWAVMWSFTREEDPEPKYLGSQATLARRARLTDRAVRHALKRLEKAGLIQQVGKGKTVRWLMVFLEPRELRETRHLSEPRSYKKPEPRSDKKAERRSDNPSESFGVLTEKDDDDGATRSAPKRALRAAPRQEIPALQQEIMDALGYNMGEAKEWAGNKLNGKNPRNQEAYLRKCLENHVAETHRDGGTTVQHRKPTTKRKTSGGFVCPRCGRGFRSKSSLGSHAGHCATTECPDCNETMKTRDLDWHRTHIHGWKPPFTAFKDSLADQPPCIHGVPGGSVPYQGGIPGQGSLYGWMACPQCRRAISRSA